MKPMAALRSLLDRPGDDPEMGLRLVLELTCELIDVSVAAVQLVGDQAPVVRVGPASAKGEPDAHWLAPGWEGTAVLHGPPGVATPAVGSTGEAVGVLWALRGEDQLALTDKDLYVLAALGEAAGALLEAIAVPAPEPVATTDLERVSRPFLEALHALTGLGSTYLTVVDERAGSQQIRYAHNAREGFAIPEDLEVPWSDTLCKRSLEEGRAFTTDVPAVWADSEAARALGIQVYLSVPVRLPSGELWGTLCAADNQANEVLAQHLATFEIFARLIAEEVVRDLALQSAREAAAVARHQLHTDELTGCTTRRSVEPWLTQQLALVGVDEVVVGVFVDVDKFKQVNDSLGHLAGDEALRQLGSQLRAISRPGDLVSRIGGDEFLLAARLPADRVPAFVLRVRGATGFTVEGRSGSCSLGWAERSTGTAQELVAAADAAMYAEKLGRVPLPLG